MQRVIVDQPLRNMLHTLVGPAELCDEDGQLLGHFVPAAESEKLVRPSDQCPYTEEQLARFQKEKGARPLAEIWKSLGRT